MMPLCMQNYGLHQQCHKSNSLRLLVSLTSHMLTNSHVNLSHKDGIYTELAKSNRTRAQPYVQRDMKNSRRKKNTKSHTQTHKNTEIYVIRSFLFLHPWPHRKFSLYNQRVYKSTKDGKTTFSHMLSLLQYSRQLSFI